MSEASGIPADEVRRIARLAALDLTDEEIGPLTRQMGELLQYFQQLQRLDTRDVEPTAHVLDLVNALRDDQPRPSLEPGEATRNAPEAESGHFKVPPVL